MKKTVYALLICFSGFSVHAQFVETIAGNGTPTALDGTGTTATFFHPVDVATDNQDNIYVADQGNHLIRKISNTGVVTTLAGSGTAGYADGIGAAASFDLPSGIIYFSGYLYVTDYGNNRIRQIDAQTGQVWTIAGSGTAGAADGTGTAAQFNGPVGICLFSAQELLVAEQLGNKIRKVNFASGEVTTFAGTGAADHINGPALSAAFSGCHDVFSSMGIVVVADQHNNEIRLIQGGNVSTWAGTGAGSSTDGPTLNASFHVPLSLCGDEGGNLYVLDYASGKVRKIDNTANVSTLFGDGWDMVDGDFTVARLNQPTGMCLNYNGDQIIIADYGNNRIRRASLAGNLSVDENDDPFVSVFPNPAENLLHISMEETIDQIVIRSLLGQTVFQGVGKTVDVASLQPGAYYITLSTQSGEYRRKFIKK